MLKFTACASKLTAHPATTATMVDEKPANLIFVIIWRSLVNPHIIVAPPARTPGHAFFYSVKTAKDAEG
ncbi:hypothetical protein RAM80_03775 [Pseudomonas sp. App30]|uniref:hypothetical protein n=1 Tax=Pseudomonas sp. App30 TaxID=3068990 RepID=UPI003A802625